MPGWLPILVTTCLCLAACTPATSPEGPSCGRVLTGSSPEDPWLAIEGASDELTVFVAGASQPVAGRMEARGRRRVFRPAFPLTPGLSYVVRADHCEAHLTLPRPAAVPPRVQAIYPRSALLPENILRFYIYFSEPMAEGDFIRHIRLENVTTGENLNGVFFDNIHELWSSDRRRITLLVDPGRVKTGLHANQELGRAFHAGSTYRLTVLPTWRSLRGLALASTEEKQFVASAEDRGAVDPAAWRITLSPEGSRDSILVDFGEPVDHVSVHRLLGVRSLTGQPRPGRWKVLPGDRRAHWTPDSALVAPLREHQLVVHTRFEDVVGNNVRGAFDHAVGDTRLQREDGIVVRPLVDEVR